MNHQFEKSPAGHVLNASCFIEAPIHWKVRRNKRIRKHQRCPKIDKEKQENSESTVNCKQMSN